MPGCDNLCRVCGLLYFYLCQLWRPVPGMWIVIFQPMPAVTTCARYTECCISIYASCAGCTKFCFSTYASFARLWRPVPDMWIVTVLPMPAVTTCVEYVDCYISTYASCTRCAKFCFSTYANCARLWQPVLGMWIVIFLPMPAVTTCAGYTEGYIFTYASFAGCTKFFPPPMSIVPGCDDLCRVYRGLFFYLHHLRQVLFFYLYQLCQAVTNCAGYVDCFISTYASCAGCGKFYFSTYSNSAMLWRPVQGMWIVIFLPVPAVTTCTGQTECYIFTHANCAGGTSVVFYLCQLSGRNITPCITCTGCHSWHR